LIREIFDQGLPLFLALQLRPLGRDPVAQQHPVDLVLQLHRAAHQQAPALDHPPELLAALVGQVALRQHALAQVIGQRRRVVAVVLLGALADHLELVGVHHHHAEPL